MKIISDTFGDMDKFPIEKQATTFNEITTAVRRKEGQKNEISCLLAVHIFPGMKVKLFFVRLFSKQGKGFFLFSEAMSEAFVEMFKEMGYKINNKK